MFMSTNICIMKHLNIIKSIGMVEVQIKHVTRKWMLHEKEIHVNHNFGISEYLMHVDIQLTENI